jgi:hypothetical protein
MTSPVPDHLPQLGRHAHLSPDDGACLMEYVAVLGGNRFTDRPTGTHPLLAAIARGVNDATSDTARPALAYLAPDLVGLYPQDPAAAVAIVDTCLNAALAVAPRSPALRRYGRRTRRRRAWLARHPRRGWPARLAETVWLRGLALHAMERAVRTLAAQRDADTRLHHLLASAIAAARGTSDNTTIRPVVRADTARLAPVDDMHRCGISR